MKKLSIYTGIGLLMLLAGCNKFLEQAPDNRTSLNTPGKVSQLLASAYPQANYMAFSETISDNAQDKGSGDDAHNLKDPFYFQDVEDNQEDSPEFYWNACYAAIAAANHAYIVCTTAADTTQYNAQKGEALVARAYAHFMLTTFFAKKYNPATSGADPGIPYVTEPEEVVLKQYERKTVQYDYDMIERDLQTGLPLLDDNTYSIPKYHFTRAAAHAFAARFYLFKQKYDSVIKHATLVFGNAGFENNLRPWNTDYLTLNYRELFARYEKATENANILLCETKSWWARNFTATRYGLSQSLNNEIFRTPVTGGDWAFKYQSYTQGEENIMMPKIYEYFVKNSVNANIGNAYIMVPLFTTEEVLFNRAEAYILTDNLNEAVVDLNTYASKRIRNYSALANGITTSKVTSYYRTSSYKAGLIATLMDFKRAEFAQEGMRWFDLKRYDVPVYHEFLQGTGVIGADSLTATDNRRVFQLPQTSIALGLQPNPR